MPTSTLSVAQIKKRVVSSFLSLTIRQIALRTIGFVSINIILARFLPVATLGIFNIATSVVTFFSFFSDIGLAASLIQKKEEISQEDIKTTFTIQQLIVTSLSLLILFLAPLIGDFYQLNSDGVWLIRILGISFFLSSLKVVPSVLLERELKFNPLVTVEIAETLTFNLLLIVLVFKGIGILSFSVAALSRGVVGVVLIYLLAPVKIRLGISRSAAKSLLSFGLPYQTNSLLALLKDKLNPLIIAKIIGPVGVGYVTWSQAMAYLPLEVMSTIIRISFPAMSRLQEDRQSLTKAVEKSLFITALTVYPLLFGLAAVMPAIIIHVVSSKWQPATLSFYLFAFAAFWAVISTTFTNALNAIGFIKTTLKLMVFWTLTTWVLTPLLVWQFGFLGVGLSSFIISFSSVITIILLKRILAVKVWESISLPVICSASMALAVYLLSTYLVTNKATLLVTVVIGGVIYTGLVWIFGRRQLLNDFKNLKDV